MKKLYSELLNNFNDIINNYPLKDIYNVCYYIPTDDEKNKGYFVYSGENDISKTKGITEVSFCDKKIKLKGISDLCYMKDGNLYNILTNQELTPISIGKNNIEENKIYIVSKYYQASLDDLVKYKNQLKDVSSSIRMVEYLNNMNNNSNEVNKTNIKK